MVNQIQIQWDRNESDERNAGKMCIALFNDRINRKQMVRLTYALCNEIYVLARLCSFKSYARFISVQATIPIPHAHNEYGTTTRYEYRNRLISRLNQNSARCKRSHNILTFRHMYTNGVYT